jgi:hypothetical protein
MKVLRALTIASALLFTGGAFAKSPWSYAPGLPHAGMQEGAQSHDTAGKLPSVEEQVKVLAEKLNLSATQQAKIKPIMQGLHAATEKLLQDEHLSQQERLDKVRPLRKKADQEIRAVLSDDQRKRLDQYEAGPHDEMHGTLTGTPAQSSQPAKPPAR